MQKIKGDVMKEKNSLLVLAFFSLGISITVQISAVEPAQEGKTNTIPLELEKPAYVTPWVRYKGWPENNWVEYSTLSTVAPSPPGNPIKIEGAIEGDPKKGEKLAFDRTRGGSCVACHVMGKPTPALPGNVGPDLSTYGTLGRS